MIKPDYEQLADKFILENAPSHRMNGAIRSKLAELLSEMYEAGREFEGEALEKFIRDIRS